MTASHGIRGIHVFWMVFAFFALIVVADTLFIVNAVGSFPGEQVRNSYVLGLDYNRKVERRGAQARLGWRAEAGFQEDGRQMLVVRLRSAQDAAIEGLDVHADLHAAGLGGEAQRLELFERTPGEYAAPVDIVGPARVDLEIVVRRRGEGAAVFEASKSLVIS